MLGDCGHLGRLGVPCTFHTPIVTFGLESRGLLVGATLVCASYELFCLDKLVRLLFVFVL